MSSRRARTGTGTATTLAAGVLMSWAAAGCAPYEPRVPDCVLACVRDSECPQGLICSGQRCGRSSCPIAPDRMDALEAPPPPPSLIEVYVSSSLGSATGNGTREKPLRSLQVA